MVAYYFIIVNSNLIRIQIAPLQNGSKTMLKMHSRYNFDCIAFFRYIVITAVGYVLIAFSFQKYLNLTFFKTTIGC